MSQERSKPWLMSPYWPIDKDKPMSHLTPEDLRRWIWCITHGIYAKKSATVFEPQSNADNAPERFARAWSDVMLPYPSQNITYQSAQERDANCKWPYYAPGDLIVYYAGGFTHNYVRTTSTEFVFNLTQTGAYSIWGQNCQSGYTIYVAQDYEQWYIEQDNLRPGTPFIVKTGHSANLRFFRVRSAEIRDDGGVNRLFVAVDDNNYNQQELQPDSQGGQIECNFGGDWYILRGANGHVEYPAAVNDYLDQFKTNIFFQSEPDYVYQGNAPGKWWSAKDLYHRYAGNVRGPHDGRPPDGGQLSIDFNNDWVRCVNPNLYHSYDKNAHRWHIAVKWTGSSSLGYTDFEIEQFDCWQGHVLLPLQTDPKEQTSPFYFNDTKRAHWKIGGKVKISAKQLTDPATLGAKNACVGQAEDRGQGSYPRFVGTSIDNQYPKSTLAQAYQNAIEAAASWFDWKWPVDDDYKLNWVWINWNNVAPQQQQKWVTGNAYAGLTYGQIYTQYGLNAAYMPFINDSQPLVASMKDEIWGENGSAFELALKLCGEYDWYLDDQTPYMSKRINDQKWVWYLEQSTLYPSGPTPGYYNGVYCTTYEQIREACWPVPYATWRRTWKWSLGRPKDRRMRDGARGEPMHPRQWSNYDPANSLQRMPTRCVMSENGLSDNDFYTWSETATRLNSRQLSISGDKRTRLKTGAQIAVIGAQKQQLFIIKHELDGSNNTIITVNDDIQSGATLTLKGDDNIIQRHDADEFFGATRVYLRRVPDVLNNCRSVLEQFKYVQAGYDISLYYYIGSAGDYPSAEGEIDWGAVMSAFRQAVEAARADVANKSLGDYSSSGYFSLLESGNISVNYYPSGYGGNPNALWNASVGCWTGRAYIGVENYQFEFPIEEDGRALYALLSFWPGGVNEDGTLYKDFSTSNAYPIIKGAVNLQMTRGNYWYYQLVRCDLKDAQKIKIAQWWPPDTYITRYCFPFELFPKSGWLDLTNYGYDGGNNRYFWIYDGTASTYVNLSVNNNDYVVGFDFTKFADEIWARTHERADWRAIDPYARYDRQPPIPAPWLFEPPHIYNENADDDSWYPPSSTEIWSQEPKWRLRVAGGLAEDLEGNGVEYIYDYEHDTSSVVDDYDRAQTARVADIVIGDNDAAWALMDEKINEWTLAHNTKDVYSGALTNQQDNYNTPTEPVNIILRDDVPMFPTRPRLHVVKEQFGSTWYDHIWTDPIWVMPDKSPLQYRLEVWKSDDNSWVVFKDWTDSKPTPPSGGQTGENHFYYSGTIAQGFTITSTSVFTYRMRVRNSQSKKSMYSYPVKTELPE